MKALIALTLLAFALPQTPTNVKDTSRLEVTQFSYKRKMIERERLVSEVVSYQPPVLDKSTIKLPDRSPDNNNPLLTTQKDTSQRKADLESLGTRAAATTGVPAPKELVFVFEAQMRNNSSKPITRFAWAYRWSANSQDFPDQEYLCSVAIKAGETKPVKLISPIPRPRVVYASGTPPALYQPALQNMIVNKVEFADGTTWQRADWNGMILLTRVGARKLKSGKCLAL